MKRNAILIFLSALLFVCCKEEPRNIYTIGGQTETPNGDVYIFGADSRYEKIDSAECDANGIFSLSLEVDTVIPLFLVTPEGKMIPVYAEPRLTATLKRDSTLKSGWCIEGGNTQALHDSIARVLDGCTNNTKLIEKIDSFILANPISDVSIEVLRRYLTETPEPVSKDIRSRTSKFGGVLKDYEYIINLNRKVDTKNSNVLHRTFPEFKYATSDSTEVALENYIRKYTIVTLWASWDQNSIERMRELASIKDSVKSSSFAILNIALDYDSTQWRKAITEDSIVGDNVIDMKMFDSPIVKQFNVKSLPFTMLVSPYQRVVDYDIDTEGLGTRLDSLTRKYDKGQEKKKEREEKERKKREELEKKKEEERKKEIEKKIEKRKKELIVGE